MLLNGVEQFCAGVLLVFGWGDHLAPQGLDRAKTVVCDREVAKASSAKLQGRLVLMTTGVQREPCGATTAWQGGLLHPDHAGVWKGEGKHAVLGGGDHQFWREGLLDCLQSLEQRGQYTLTIAGLPGFGRLKQVGRVTVTVVTRAS
jgi:hypothetical protein